MRRLLALQPVDTDGVIEGIGNAYLDGVRALRPAARAVSIASYEDGGLSRVFSAMLRAPEWRGAGQEAFRFFLEEHIRFDSDDAGGHASLSRHLIPNDDILPLWTAFAELLTAAAPRAPAPRRGLGNPARRRLPRRLADCLLRQKDS